MDAARSTPAAGTTTGRVRRGAPRALTVGVLVPAVAVVVGHPGVRRRHRRQGSASGSLCRRRARHRPKRGTPGVTFPATGAAQTTTLATVTAPGLGWALGVARGQHKRWARWARAVRVTSSAEIADVDLGTPDVILVPGLDLLDRQRHQQHLHRQTRPAPSVTRPSPDGWPSGGPGHRDR